MLKKIGITKFDTALVYGNGKVEKLLSKVIDESDTILTKIPARIKPVSGRNMPLINYYDEDYINCCIEKSLYNLNRKKIEIVLLHNWTEEWNNKPILLDWLITLKNRKIVKKIGISLHLLFVKTAYLLHLLLLFLNILLPLFLNLL